VQALKQRINARYINKEITASLLFFLSIRHQTQAPKDISTTNNEPAIMKSVTPLTAMARGIRNVLRP